MISAHASGSDVFSDHRMEMGRVAMARARREVHTVRTQIKEGIEEYCETQERSIRERKCGTMTSAPAWSLPPTFLASKTTRPSRTATPADHTSLLN